MHPLFNIGFHIGTISSTDLSEPSALSLAAMCLALLLLRRRPFARSKRHSAINEMLTGIAHAKEQIISPLKRVLRSAEPKTPSHPWLFTGLECLENRQLMCGSSPSPASTPPPQNESAIEATPIEPTSSASPQKNQK